jgi:hypothetical protein
MMISRCITSWTFNPASVRPRRGGVRGAPSQLLAAQSPGLLLQRRALTGAVAAFDAAVATGTAARRTLQVSCTAQQTVSRDGPRAGAAAGASTLVQLAVDSDTRAVTHRQLLASCRDSIPDNLTFGVELEMVFPRDVMLDEVDWALQQVDFEGVPWE